MLYNINYIYIFENSTDRPNASKLYRSNFEINIPMFTKLDLAEKGEL